MKDFHHTCICQSHILANKVCQDASFSCTTDAMSIAIVCDGHGGDRYFRSDQGSKFAIDATRDCVEEFVSKVNKDLFEGKPLVRKNTPYSESSSKDYTKDTDVDKALRQLFSSIIYKWKGKIMHHANETPLSEDEKASIKPDWQHDFENEEVGKTKTYGCTLMCYVHTDSFWFAFQIGDGKCIAFDENGQWSEPVPWDDRCFLNKTTSLSDSSALEEFRYCYCGKGYEPLAVFLGSDGIDDSFGATENMVNFYVQILKLIKEEGLEIATENIKETLPQLSKMGSQDDMSIACVYDDVLLADKVKSLVEWQKNNIDGQLHQVDERIQKLKGDIDRLHKGDLDAQKVRIDLEYANKDLDKAFERRRSLIAKRNKFAEELEGKDFTPYPDEIDRDEHSGPETVPVAETPKEASSDGNTSQTKPLRFRARGKNDGKKKKGKKKKKKK